MNFAQPAYLWTLAAMAIPLAIHLLSRKEGKVVKVGSLRHMEASTTSRFKSLRLNELLLLAVRCLLIVWLALFLSGATCSSPKSGRETPWLLTEGGMGRNPLVKPLIDSLTKSGYEWRLLADGFPPYDPADSVAPGSYWTLTERLATTNRDIVVISYNLMNGFRQRRGELPPNVRWISLDPPDRNFLYATQVVGDSIDLRKGHSSSGETSQTTSRIRRSDVTAGDDSVPVNTIDTISVAIVADDEYARDAHVLKAAIRAMNDVYGSVIVETTTETADWLFWLRRDEPQHPFSSKTILLRAKLGDKLISQRGPMEWHLTNRINAEEAITNHLVIELAEVILTTHEGNVNDIRTMPEEIAWSDERPTTSSSAGRRATSEISIWLIILFAATWASERALALAKNL